MSETGTEQQRSSVSVEFAELVKKVLAERTWSLGFVPERRWNPVFNLEGLVDTRVVTVVPRTVLVSRYTRGANLHQPICEVGVMFKPDLQKLVEGEIAEEFEKAAEMIDLQCDKQAGLIEEIVDHFTSIAGRVYRDVGTRGLKYNVERVECTTLISHEYLEQFSQVTSVVRLTGRVAKS